MSIKKIKGHIKNVSTLSPTAKEITISLDSPLTFQAGCFVNLFLEDDGEVFRRAFSISSEDGTHNTFTLSIRRSLQGRVSQLFWTKEMIGKPVEIMGPLGRNTANNMHSKNIFLFGFGIGVGVVKSLAAHFSHRDDIDKIVIATGSRDNSDVMYKDFFNLLQEQDQRISVRYIVSKNDGTSDFKTGYIQNHINDLNFDNADIYVCGKEVACDSLVDTVKANSPENCHFFIEAFH